MQQFQPRSKKKVSSTKTRSNKAVDRDVKGVQSNDAAFRELLTLAPTAMQRVVSMPAIPPSSTPFFENSAASQAESSSVCLEADDACPDDGADSSLAELIVGASPEDGGGQQLVARILNDLLETIANAKSKRVGQAMADFYQKLTTHKIVRRAMLVNARWSLETALYEANRLFAKGKGLNSSSVVADAVVAAKLILFLLTSSQQVALESEISASCLEAIASAALDYIPSARTKAVSHPKLIYFAYAIIAQIIRRHLLHVPPTGVEDSSSAYDALLSPPSGTRDTASAPGGYGPTASPGGESSFDARGVQSRTDSWQDLLMSHTQRLIKRKENQWKSHGKTAQKLQWSAEDISVCEGLSLCWICTVVHNSGNAGLLSQAHSGGSFPNNPYGSVWDLVRSIATYTFDSAAEFMGALKSAGLGPTTTKKSGSSILGFASLVGLAFEKLWVSAGYQASKTGEIMSATNEMLLASIEGMAGQGLSGRLAPKESARFFRAVATTIETGSFPKTEPIVVQVGDIQDTLSAKHSQWEIREAQELVKAKFHIDSWQNFIVESFCENYAGGHAVLAVMLNAKDFGMEIDCSDAQVDLTRGDKNRSMKRRKEEERLRASERHQKLNRQNAEDEDD